MTTRKDKFELTSRRTAFVTREEGAAELRISPSTWDDMVKRRQLPKPYLVGPNKDLPRWWWIEVEKKIIADRRDENGNEQEPYFRGLARGQAQDH
jgi:predicted DNA-binding transcriptional regulator AlpA